MQFILDVNTFKFENKCLAIITDSSTIFCFIIIDIYIYTGWLAASVAKKLFFLFISPEWWFFQHFLKIFNFFWYSNGPKKSANLCFSQNQKLRKQKCVNRLFLSKSKILKRLNLRIAKNLQNCNKKIHNFQFWSNFYGTIVFQ